MAEHVETDREQPLLYSFYVSVQVPGDDRAEHRIRKLVEQRIASAREAYFAAKRADAATRRAELAEHRERAWMRAAVVELMVIVVLAVCAFYRG